MPHQNPNSSQTPAPRQSLVKLKIIREQAILERSCSNWASAVGNSYTRKSSGEISVYTQLKQARNDTHRRITEFVTFTRNNLNFYKNSPMPLKKIEVIACVH
jgi:hypothetical protein